MAPLFKIVERDQIRKQTVNNHKHAKCNWNAIFKQSQVL